MAHCPNMWWVVVCLMPVDQLQLKIPWRNLYGAPVVAEVVGLYVVAGPASGKGSGRSQMHGANNCGVGPVSGILMDSVLIQSRF